MEIRTALQQGIAQLRSANVSAYTLAAELLLLHAVGKERAWLYAHPEEHLTAVQEKNFLEMISRRAAGEPVQHLTGHQEFWGLEFEVNRDVLTPRPETEHLIEVALDRLALREVRAGRPQITDGAGMIVADVGTGSGCIVVALAKELPRAKFLATDVSGAALQMARRNAERHGVLERIQFLQASFLGTSFLERNGEWRVTSDATHRTSELEGLDLIVSNPPYIGRREAASLEREVRDHEPPQALYGGEEGYELYGELIAQSTERLKPGGLLVLELGYNSLGAVQPLFNGPDWVNVGVTNDLAGIPRVIAAERAAELI
jgi:release factor glutamine methyltransferase